jgi:hypothetical protein
MAGLCGALLALVGLLWSDRYFSSLNPRLWVLLVAGLGAIGIAAVCCLMAHRDRIAARRDAMWNLEVGRLSAKVQGVADEVHALTEQLTHPDGALRLALKVELSAVANQGHGAGSADYDAEITELKKAVRALESMVVPETAFYLRGFMDGQGDGEAGTGAGSHG